MSPPILFIIPRPRKKVNKNLANASFFLQDMGRRCGGTFCKKFPHAPSKILKRFSSKCEQAKTPPYMTKNSPQAFAHGEFFIFTFHRFLSEQILMPRAFGRGPRRTTRTPRPPSNVLLHKNSPQAFAHGESFVFTFHRFLSEQILMQSAFGRGLRRTTRTPRPLSNVLLRKRCRSKISQRYRNVQYPVPGTSGRTGRE